MKAERRDLKPFVIRLTITPFDPSSQPYEMSLCVWAVSDERARHTIAVELGKVEIKEVYPMPTRVAFANGRVINAGYVGRSINKRFEGV